MASIAEALNLNLWTFLLQAVNILIVIGVLYKILYKPLMNVVNEREQRIENDLEKAKDAREKAEEQLNQYKEQLSKSREEAQQIIENAKKMGEETRQQIIADANEEAQKNLDKAKKEIEAEKAKALEEIRSEASSLAVLAAGQVINKEINPEDHRQLIEQFVNEVGEVQ